MRMQVDLPDCFRNQAYVEKLVKGLKCLRNEGFQENADAEQSLAAGEPVAPPEKQTPPWQPETLFRTCLSSLTSSEAFGPMMAAEADARGFFTARKQAFLGDGLNYNWSIQRRWFPTFVAIVDFVHAVEYVYTAAKAIHRDAAQRWRQYLAWVNACWQGRVGEVIAELQQWQSQLGPLPTGVAESQVLGTRVADDIVWGLPPGASTTSSGSWVKSGCRGWPNATPADSRAASCSAWRSPRRWPASPR